MLVKTALISALVSVASASTCLWTKNCYGIAYGAGYVCGQEYPDGGRPSGNKRDCGGYSTTAYECCGVTKAITNECKWSYCAGLTIDGQTTCNDDSGPDWKYNGEYSGADCGIFSTNKRVKCCKMQSYD